MQNNFDEDIKKYLNDIDVDLSKLNLTQLNKLHKFLSEEKEIIKLFSMSQSKGIEKVLEAAYLKSIEEKKEEDEEDEEDKNEEDEEDKNEEDEEDKNEEDEEDKNKEKKEDKNEEKKEKEKEENSKKFIIDHKNNHLYLSSICHIDDKINFAKLDNLSFDKENKKINAHLDLFDKINHFSDTDLLFEMVIKSIVAKVMTTIDAYRLFHRPIDDKHNKRHTNSFAPIRSILGGKEPEKETPKVIDDEDAMNLYVRLPLLAEWYRNMFGFESKENYTSDTGNPDEFLLSVLPNMDGVWSDFNHFIYNKVYFVGDNSYNESQAKELIGIINSIVKSYRSRVKDCNWRQIIDSYVLDINRSYGFIKKKEVDAYLEDKYKLNSYEYNEDDNVEGFDILNSRDQFAPINAPSDKYTTQKLNLKQRSDKLSMYILKKKLLDFRNKIDRDFYETDKKESVKLTYTIQNYIQDMKAMENDKDKYELVLRMMQVSSKHLIHSSDKLIMLHETVAAPLSLLTSIYFILGKLSAKVNSLYFPANDVNELTNKIENSSKRYKKITEYNLISLFTHSSAENSKTSVECIKLIKMLLNLTSLPNSLITMNPVEKNINLDYNKLEEMCMTLLNLVKLNLNKMRVLFTDKSILNEFESKEKVGSVTWIEENLVEQLFKDSNGMGLSQLNTKMEKILGDCKENYNNKLKLLLYDDIKLDKDGTEEDLLGNKIKSNDAEYEGIVLLFNKVLMSLLKLNQDQSSKKFYIQLIENFANGVSSLEFNNNKSLKFDNIDNDNKLLLVETIIGTNINKDTYTECSLKYYLNTYDERTKKRKYAYESIAEIPEYMKDRMRVNLPYFIKRINIIYNKADGLKRLIKNNSLSLDDNELVDKNHSDRVLTRLMDMTNELRKSAENTLREISDINPLYMDLRQDFIQDYKSRNGKLPLMPLSSILITLQNVEKNPLLKQSLIGTDEFKFNRGVRLILGRDDIEPNMDHIPGAKDIYNSYSNTVKRNNILSMEEYTSMCKLIIKLVRYAGSVFCLNNFNKNNVSIIPKLFANEKKLNDIINLTENSNLDSNKNLLANIINTNNDNEMNRKELRINNIVDMDIVPINVHAMMREIPFVNLINYSYTFDRMVQNILSPSFNKTDYKMISVNQNVNTVNHLLLKLLVHPYAQIHDDNASYNHKPEYSILFQSLCSGNDGLRLGRPKYLSDQLLNKVLLSGPANISINKYKKNSLHRIESGPNGYAAYSLLNPLTYENDYKIPHMIKYIKPDKKYITNINDDAYINYNYSLTRFNTKIIRNLIWLVNLQRIMRVMLVQHLDFISTPVINNIQIANPKVTEYEGNEEYDDNDFNGKKYGPFGDYSDD